VTRFAVPRSIKTVLKSPRFILKNLFDEVSLDSDSVKNIQAEGSAEKNVAQIGAVKELSGILTPREKDVINRRYYENQTLEEVGKVYSLTRERMRLIEIRALRRMRRRSIALGYGNRETIRRRKESLHCHDDCQIYYYGFYFKASQQVRDLWED
jgi:hypothetical protein|tara:strand:+ start:440 stop:901 length:462 start_codon:yes stop_codon:yes gene_type:complete